MALPFTHDAFLDVFGHYNTTLWPVALILWFATAWVAWQWIRRGHVGGRLLFGLLAVYIFNLRHFSQQLTSHFWMHLVSYLNLGACSLNLATLTTRFVYPQFSLEGKRLWIVGLAPLGLRQLIKIKFWLAAGTALVITLGLISVSCYMLQMDWSQTLFFTAAVFD